MLLIIIIIIMLFTGDFLLLRMSRKSLEFASTRNVIGYCEAVAIAEDI